MALVDPHGGGELRPLLLTGDGLEAERRHAATLPRLTVSSREKGDIVMLGIGGFTPLEGFMTHADWQGVCDGMRTASGLFWPIPITLSAEQTFAEHHNVALLARADGEPRQRRGVATLRLQPITGQEQRPQLAAAVRVNQGHDDNLLVGGENRRRERRRRILPP